MKTRCALSGLPTLGLVLLAACAEAPVELDEYSCVSTQLTYDNFGREFLDRNCNSCHSTSRNGAPESFRFDTLDDVRKHAKRIFVRAATTNTSMPPGPVDPPAAERDKLAEWLACGVP